MLKTILSISVFLFSFQAFSQISTDSERDKDGNINLYTINTDVIPYTVMFHFSSLQNLNTSGGDVVTVVALPGRSRATTLKPRQQNISTNYQYKVSYIRGNLFGKTKTEPVYFLPVQEGTIVLAQNMTHLENRLQPKEKNDDYVGVSFRLKEPTDIVAPRKGIIASISMSEADEKDNLDFRRDENYIEIYHEDGSISKIMVLKSGSQKVELGELVLPGQVIASSAGENYISGSHVRMVNIKPKKEEGDKLKYEQFPVKFITEDGAIFIEEPLSISAVHPDELVTAEMSKREIKKFKAGKL